MIKQAMILAGGKGTRMLPLTKNIPKPMIEVAGKPFLEHLILQLKSHGIEEVTILLGYMSDKVVDYFQDGSEWNLKIQYSIGEIDDRTGTRIRNAKEYIEDNFILLYCDNYCPLDIKSLNSFFESEDVEAAVAVYNNNFKVTKNNVLVENNKLIKYDKSRSDSNLNGVEIGYFILNKKIFDYMPDYNFSFEEVVISELVSKNSLGAFCTEKRYYSIGSLERLPITEDYFSDKKVILLDRDGVINKRQPRADYVKTWDEFVFLPKVLESMRILKDKGYTVYVITNQPGINRGYLTHNILSNIHDNMNSVIEENGGFVSKIYYCHHDWDEGCFCRKPSPGMLISASNENSFQLDKVYFVGDDERDAEAATKAGCKPFLVDDNYTLYDFVLDLD